jgi:hypothetical protein
MKQKRSIKKVAVDVRKTLEKIAPRLNIHAAHLQGACGYGSVMLFEELKRAGYKPRIAQGSGHWFVVCDGKLVDVTATQFGQPKVVVRDFIRIQDENNKFIYNRQYWTLYGGLHNTTCSAGLCSLKPVIKKALENVTKECDVCKNNVLPAAQTFVTYTQDK